MSANTRTLKPVKNLEFAVDDSSGHERIFHTFEEAAAFAISLATSTGAKVNLDVLAWDRKAAKAWGGDYAAEEYDADPDASVHDRIVIRADSQGRIA
jgi:hypothetical protein